MAYATGMSPLWSEKSRKKLETCHKDLKIIANVVVGIHDCSVFEGHRDEETQNRYYEKGTSRVKYPDGKHNKTPSMAIDLAPYIKGGDPYDMERVLFFAGIVMAVAKMLKAQGLITHDLRWGGSWRTEPDATFAFDRNGFFDGIHFELV